MHTFRTRFKKEIVCEFLPPARQSNKVLILCAGFPSPPSKTGALEFWAKKGYWVFYPRYRGTWESTGTFLKNSPVIDILDVIEAIHHPFSDIWTGRNFKIKPQIIDLIGGSFGGAVVILASLDRRVRKVIALSPVVDWRVTKSGAESLSRLKVIFKKGYAGGIRFKDYDWNKLSRGDFFNPASVVQRIDGKKIFIFHAKDDLSVDWRPVAKFATAAGCKFKLYKKGGHFGTSDGQKMAIYKQIKAFLRD